MQRYNFRRQSIVDPIRIAIKLIVTNLAVNRFSGRFLKMLSKLFLFISDTSLIKAEEQRLVFADDATTCKY